MTSVPKLLSLATAVPPYRLDQAAVAALALRLFDRSTSEIDRLLPVYGNAGIATRYSCVPLDWYAAPHGWVERTRLYVENAGELLARATSEALRRAGRSAAEIGGILLVSTTGIATPSLDALLMERLALGRTVQRLPVFGLGCAGGVIGLGHAAAMARSMPKRLVLLLVVELCALTFRRCDSGKSNVIASALFGDGAAAALLGCDGEGALLGPAGVHTWPDSLAVMGWRVEEDGLGVLFSRDIPTLIRNDLRPVAEAFLAQAGFALSDIDGFVCHPGGAKVLDALEEAFGLAQGALAEARAVLNAYGNMSAATVLFVLERVLATERRGRLLLSALGPGFTAGFQLLEQR